MVGGDDSRDYPYPGVQAWVAQLSDRSSLEQQTADRGRGLAQLLEILNATVPGFVASVSAIISRKQSRFMAGGRIAPVQWPGVSRTRPHVPLRAGGRLPRIGPWRSLPMRLRSPFRAGHSRPPAPGCSELLISPGRGEAGLSCSAQKTSWPGSLCHASSVGPPWSRTRTRGNAPWAMA